MNPEMDKIILGDCRDIMKTHPDNFFHSVVCDPPYELTSGNSKKGFMGKAWDGSGIAYDVGMWQEVLRVLKPGGHMLAFGGTRTYHRMACAIEDAGFECRDMLEWVYGSGFPKSLNISKAIDRELGIERTEKQLRNKYYDGGIRKMTRGDTEGKTCYGKYGDLEHENGLVVDTKPASPEAQTWAGFGTSLKPAHEPIGLFRKPLACKTIAENVLEWGCGGLNIDGCRIATNGESISIGFGDSKRNGVNNMNTGWDRPWRKDTEYSGEKAEQSLDKANSLGRFPANLIWSHSPLCKRIGTKKVKGNAHYSYKPTNDGVYKLGLGQLDDLGNPLAGADGMETVESWDCHICHNTFLCLSVL